MLTLTFASLPFIFTLSFILTHPEITSPLCFILELREAAVKDSFLAQRRGEWYIVLDLKTNKLVTWKGDACFFKPCVDQI